VPGKKKIFVDLMNLASPEIAGVGVFTRNLLTRWLAINEKRDYDVVCFASVNIDAEKVFGFATSPGVSVKYIGAKHVLARFLVQQLIFPFRLIGYDLYFNPTLGLPFLARIFSPRTKLLVTIHDMIPFFFSRKYSWKRSLLVKAMSKYAAKAAHHVITVSGNSKKDITTISGVRAEKVSVVYNFIDREFESANTADQSYFLCISTLEPGKNVENTIRGFSIFLKESRLPVKFYWIGRVGWVYSESYLRELIRSEKVEDSFILPGYVDEKAKEKFLRECTAIVYLSFYEGFGLPVLEGFTYNKAALVSNNSSLPEAVGKAGVLCDPSDPRSIAEGMETIIRQGALLKAEIPAQLQRFTPDKQFQSFCSIIDSLIPQTR
jgi:glycosyltransferase involved in cell wall biosynthesis